MKYCRLYADANGKSHIEDKELDSTELDFKLPGRPRNTSRLEEPRSRISLPRISIIAIGTDGRHTCPYHTGSDRQTSCRYKKYQSYRDDPNYELLT